MTHNPLRSRPLTVIPPRRDPTKAEQTAAWNRENGICYLCLRPVAFTGPGVEWEHRDNRAVSGRDDVGNIYPVHPACHTPKTAADAKRTAKAKAQERMTQPRTEKAGGFRKHPTLVRGVDGQVRERRK